MEVLRVIMFAASAALSARAAWQIVVGWQHGKQRLLDFMRDPSGAFHRHVEEMPLDYPPSVILVADLTLAIASIAAVAQRHSYFPSLVPLLAILLVIFTYPILTVFGVQPRPIPLSLIGLVSEGLFLLQPVPLDASPFVLVVIAGEVAAIGPKHISLPFTAAALAELVVFHMVGPGIDALASYLIAVVLGAMVGIMMQYQRLYLYQERENQTIRTAQAADEERHRIAREVHDVIAHSLSITLLHLTAARHSLQTDRDVDEAVDALVDAERLGRQAMADIRRTVGLLGERPSPVTPEPSLDDVTDLVDDFVRAGLEVDFQLTGDSRIVPATTGLALYRITQESLANVAKHARGAAVTLRITVSAAEATVTIDNTVPGWQVIRRGGGMGIAGMRQRANLLGGTLSAGPASGSWHVAARIPLGKPGLSCAPTGQDDPLRLVRDAFSSVTRKFQESV
ncbi:sensor histidine kinase [Nocardia aurantia]|uniref:sensor histidine kinase n=1 Tax=Nocardia aurantia TaxID=2585199 RepID=UPI001294F396|nr:histidine kinase [Nocardia aurantia]